MNPSPLISVVMPAYNAGRYIDAAVASILRQSCTNFELLAFDDGSTDDTMARLQSWRQRDARVVVNGGSHRGYCAWLNAGLELGRGTWIARMDADDVALPDRFALQLNWLREHPDYVALGGGFEAIDEDDDSIYIHLPETEHEKLVEGLLSGWGSQLCHPAVFLSRAAARQAGGYRAEFESAEDVDLFLRLARIGKLGALRQVLLRYRWHLRSVSHERRTRQQSAVNEILRAEWARLGSEIPPAVANRLAALTARASQPIGTRDLQERIIWLARKEGNLRTARKHAGRLLRHAWSDRRAWRLWLECWGPTPRPERSPPPPI